MRRKLILNAYSSNSGGGRAGLLSLLGALTVEATIFIDQRLKVNESVYPTLKFIRVRPTFFGRLAAEKKIKQLIDSDTWVLRLGSVPPFFNLDAPTFVFFENRYLLEGEGFGSLPLKVRLRLGLEKILIRMFRKNASAFIVQSQSMADGLVRTLGTETKVKVMPFHSTHALTAATPSARDIDFIYASSGDSHKNHRNLVLAWKILAEENLRPSLYLTVDSEVYPELADFISETKSALALKIENVGFLSVQELEKYYQRARAMIFPSTVESFGRPLIEGRDMGLAVLAPEMDYVRDVIDPAQSFDPASPRSIARAVKRHLGVTEKRASILSPAEFLKALHDIAR